MKTIVLGGVATNFGVESTARDAWEKGYELVIAEDSCASRSTEMHDFAVNTIFPRLSRVTKSEEIVLTGAPV
jgi:nicotinamidase-related amidase